MFMLKCISRGVQHVVRIAGAALMPDQRQQLLVMIHVLRQSRTALRETGLPGLMRYLDAQAAAHDFTNPASIRHADAIAALMPMRPFRHCMKRAILRYII